MDADSNVWQYASHIKVLFTRNVTVKVNSDGNFDELLNGSVNRPLQSHLKMLYAIIATSSFTFVSII